MSLLNEKKNRFPPLLREILKHTFLMVGTLTIRDCNGNKIRWSKCKPNECSIDDLTNDKKDRKKIKIKLE